MSLTAQQQSFIRGMEKVGKLVAATLDYTARYIKVGMTTNDIDRLVHDYTLTHDAIPAPLRYEGFPKSVCTSVNQMICHGVPNDLPLKEGDIVNVDVTSILGGYFGDSSRTFMVGTTSQKIASLVDTAYAAMHEGISILKPGLQTGDIGYATQAFVRKAGFFVCKEIGGHGIGTIFHDDPFIPSFGNRRTGPKLKPWTCITVEPAINEKNTGSKEISIAGSTITEIETENSCWSAQFEHTVLITDNGYQILTQS
jgi:methionyl aminopeptidase